MCSRSFMRMTATVAGVAAVFAAGAFVVPGCGSRPDGNEAVHVAAAADLKFAFDEVKAELERRNPGLSIKATYGSSGTFASQIPNGAPFDVFLSADAGYPARLIEQGAAAKGDDFKYAVGRIVLWARNDSPMDMKSPSLEALAAASVRKIAIATPAHAPYGRAAVAALKAAGVYDKVTAKLVLGENAAQTAQFAQSAADAGIIPLSLALAATMQKTGTYWEIPQALYPMIEQSGVILKSARDRRAAELVRDFILSADGQGILKRYGFAPPGG